MSIWIVNHWLQLLFIESSPLIISSWNLTIKRYHSYWSWSWSWLCNCYWWQYNWLLPHHPHSCFPGSVCHSAGHEAGCCSFYQLYSWKSLWEYRLPRPSELDLDKCKRNRQEVLRNLGERQDTSVSVNKTQKREYVISASPGSWQKREALPKIPKCSESGVGGFVVVKVLSVYSLYITFW